MSAHHKSPTLRRRPASAGFTLTELLTSMAILGVMMAVLFSIFDQIQKAWLSGENRVETFTQARAALDYMSRELSEAIATNIIFYAPDDKHLYFVAPVNTNPQNQSDLCEIGYEFERQNPGAPPPYLTMRIARRVIEPSSANIANGKWNIYSPTWYTAIAGQPINPLTDAALASNCVFDMYFQLYDQTGALITFPHPAAKGLPASIVIVMTNVDSRTAAKLNIPSIGSQNIATWLPIVNNSSPRVFTTTVYLPNLQSP
jgi:prepilin-type N-terminal cleavage/methylation domain-containing protein